MNYDQILETVGKYSDFHDAEIRSLEYSSSQDTVTVGVRAQEFESDRYDDLTVVCSRACHLQILPPPVAGRSMEDYLFPVERTLDRLAITNLDVGIQVALLGTYGWKIFIDCGSVELRGA